MWKTSCCGSSTASCRPRGRASCASGWRASPSWRPPAGGSRRAWEGSGAAAPRAGAAGFAGRVMAHVREQAAGAPSGADAGAAITWAAAPTWVRATCAAALVAGVLLGAGLGAARQARRAAADGGERSGAHRELLGAGRQAERDRDGTPRAPLLTEGRGPEVKRWWLVIALVLSLGMNLGLLLALALSSPAFVQQQQAAMRPAAPGRLQQLADRLGIRGRSAVASSSASGSSSPRPPCRAPACPRFAGRCGPS